MKGYSDVFQNQLKPAVQRKRWGVLSSGVCLQYDNAQHHTAPHTMQQIQDLKLELLPHTPNSPCVAPSDLHLFWPLKDATRGHNLRSDVTGGWHDNRKSPPLDNLGLSGMLEKVCRMQWG